MMKNKTSQLEKYENISNNYEQVYKNNKLVKTVIFIHIYVFQTNKKVISNKKNKNYQRNK